MFSFTDVTLYRMYDREMREYSKLATCQRALCGLDVTVTVYLRNLRVMIDIEGPLS
jgi:hypothetical protein